MRSLWRGHKKEMKIIHRRPVAFSNSLTGTVTNAYADILDWPCLGVFAKTIHLKNTGGMVTLKYKVLSYAHAGGIPWEEVAETDLVASSWAQIFLDHAHAAVKVQVKTVAGTTGYQLDYNGAKR